MIYAIALALTLAVAAVLNRAMDEMNDHWDQTFFHSISDGLKDAYFGHRDYVYRRRYDEHGELLPRFKIPVVSNVLEAVNDGWHLFKSIRLVLLILVAPLLVVGVATVYGFNAAVLSVVVGYAVSYAAFELSHNLFHK